MLQAGVIEESSGEWAFNVVIVSKIDGSTPRTTIDFRRLNEITYKDRFPLPRISDCLDALSGAVYFSTVDVSSSFYQIEVEESCRDAAFIPYSQGPVQVQENAPGDVERPQCF